MISANTKEENVTDDCPRASTKVCFVVSVEYSLKTL